MATKNSKKPTKAKKPAAKKLTKVQKKPAKKAVAKKPAKEFPTLQVKKIGKIHEQKSAEAFSWNADRLERSSY